MTNIKEKLDYIKNEKLPYFDSVDHDGVVYGRSAFKMDWVTKLIGDTPSIIFDVGCYDCGDSIRFKKTFPEAKVYAFEASINRHEKLEMTCDKYDINLIKNAVSDQNAVSDSNGLEIFYDSLVDNERIDAQGSFFKHTEAYKSSHPRIIQQEEGYEVETVTISYFCAENNIEEIDVLHLDVEGAELLVINGFGKLRPKLVFLETLDVKHGGDMWEDSPNTSDVGKKMDELGYITVKQLGADRLYIHNDHLKTLN